MLRKQIAVGFLVAIVAGLLSLTVPTGLAQQAQSTTIQLGDFWFGATANQIPVGKPEVNVATISGAASGTVVIVFQNVGKLEHEITIAGLFETAAEAIIKSFDASGNEISKIEAVGGLREVELQPGMKAEVTLSLDEPLVRPFVDDPSLELHFEIACHVGHGTSADHYKAGMRGLITLKP